MQCPKCGKKLKNEQLYCEHCGEEICIVPDFDPLVDYSMNSPMSDEGDSIDSEPESNELTANSKKIFLNKFEKYKKRLYLNRISIVAIILIFIILIFLFRQNKYSNDDKFQEAIALFNEESYTEALSIYDKIIEHDPSGDIRTHYAECLYASGNYDKAVSYLYLVIEEIPNHELAYALLISMLEENREFEELNQILQNCSSDAILEKYQTYMAVPPEFSIKDGVYEEVQHLVLKSSSGGKIFYSTDGSDPIKDGSEYFSPLYLSNGTYNIKAVSINDYGIVSDVVEAKYTINSKIPYAPVVVPESGIYHMPMLITVIAEHGSTVYYTNDGSIPTDKSLLYHDSIPMKEGTSNYHFIAIDEYGISSEVTSRTYTLTVESTLTADESLYRLRHRLLEKERILDLEGHTLNGKGNFIYVYDSLRSIDNKVMHVIAEYYTEDGKHRNMTGSYYAIDVSNGYVYKIIKDDNDSFTLDPI